MRPTRKTCGPAFLTAFMALSLLIFPFVSRAADTGPVVTRDDINSITRSLEAKRRQYLAEQEEMVRAIGSRLLRQVKNPLNIDFQVQESQDINAGATFGKIVVTTGMIRFTTSEDELAVVLGHEIAHVAKGHMTKTIISNIPLMIGSMLAESAAPGAGRIVQMGGSIFTQKFSRDMEREADYYGILYAHAAGFDVEEGVEIWERFAIELPESQKTTIFSSHPGSTERLARARKIADTLQGHNGSAAPVPQETPEIIGPQSVPVGRPGVVREQRAVQRAVRENAPVRIAGGEVVAKRNSRTVHYPDCPLLSDTDPKDLIRFRSRGDAVRSGGIPCEVCRP